MNQMVKLFYTFILGLGLFACLFAKADDSVKRGSAIISWTSQTVDKGFILSNELYNQKYCNRIYSKQIPEFLKKNPNVKDPNKFSPGDQILIQTCSVDAVPVPKMAKAKNLPIKTEWIEVKTKKNFLLKDYIQKVSGCVVRTDKNSFAEQIKIFKQKNPLISNVEEIPEESVLSLQRCPASVDAPNSTLTPKEVAFNVLVEATYIKMDDERNEQVAEDDASEPLPTSGQSSGSDNAQIGVSSGSAQSSSDVSGVESGSISQNFLLGVMIESGKSIQPELGYIARLGIYPNVEYQPRFDLDPKVLYFNNQINFLNHVKTKEDSAQTFIGFGLGQRYSFQPEKTDTNQSRGVDSYTFLSLGYRRDFKNSFFEAQGGFNLAKSVSPNLSIIALRRLNETHFMLGGYADYRSSKSLVENGNGMKNYITGGLIFSY